MRIEAIDYTSPHLPTVKALGKANNQTLGFLPEGAFEQYATRRLILVALDDDDRCLGYLLFRQTGGHAIIAHLCVADFARGQGVARNLCFHLRDTTRHLRGIRADCRRDFAADTMWPRFGFRPISERPGRAKHGSTLTIWWLDHGHPDLFTTMLTEQRALKLFVAIDTNIFYDLIDSSRPAHEESEALRADWLQEDIELAVSDELWNEINRGMDTEKRRRASEAAGDLTRLQTDHVTFDAAQHKLRPLFPTILSTNDESDLRQIAHAAAADVPFFVMRDEDILAQADEVYRLTKLSILRPSDLIVHIDELRHEAAYQPARLAGTLMEIRRIQSGEQGHLVTAFHCDAQGESRADFAGRLRKYLTTPATSESFTAVDSAGVPLALTIYDQTQPDEVRVPLFRVRRGSLAATLIRYGLLMATSRAAQLQRPVLRFTDPYLDEATITAIRDDGFTSVGAEWWKLSFAVAESASELATRLRAIASSYSHIEVHARKLVDILVTPAAPQDIGLMAMLEKALWPAKIADADIPTFLVPIQPHWAQELFDANLANQTLFGATRNLILNREAIYYRASHPHVLTAPGRILWYVSQDRQHRYQGSGAIRVCSQLDEVVVDLPKTLYRRFRRFGIYEWPHVLNVVHNNLVQPIMALRFSNTELFTHPIKLEELRTIYKAHGQGLMLQGPSRFLTPEVSMALYRRGMLRSRGESAEQ